MLKKSFTGASLAFLSTVSFSDQDTVQSLEEFELYVYVSCSVLGKKVMFSSETGMGRPLSRLGDNVLGINLSGEDTSQMGPGTLVMTLRLRHKTTGALFLTEQKLMELVEPINNIR